MSKEDMIDTQDGRQVTLADVAQQAGVSISTVSLVLSGKGRVSEAVRNQVREIAERLDYKARPNRYTKSQLVGLVIEDLPFSAFEDNFFSRLIFGVESALVGAGLRPSLAVMRTEEDKKGLLETCSEEFAGIIVLGGGDLGDGFLGELVRRDLPVVLGDTYLPGEKAHSVIADNFGGAFSAVSHLIGCGHRRIGMIRGSEKYKPLNDRWMGYMCALHAHGLPVMEELVPVRSSHGLDKGYTEMQALLDLPEPPTAVFACSDRTAIRAIDAAKERGLSIPGDMSVIGFDDIPEASRQNPPLSSVRLPLLDLGRFAGMRLLSVMEGREPMPYMTTLPTELVCRESTRGRHNT